MFLKQTSVSVITTMVCESCADPENVCKEGGGVSDGLVGSAHADNEY